MEITLNLTIPGDVAAAIEQTFPIFVVLFLSLNVWPYFSIFRQGNSVYELSPQSPGAGERASAPGVVEDMKASDIM